MKFNTDSMLLTSVGKTVVRGYIQKEDRSQVLLRVIEDNQNYSLEVLATSNKTYFKGRIPIRNVEFEDGEDLEWSVEGNNFKVLLDLLPTISIDVAFALTPNTGKVFQVTAPNRKMKLAVLDSIINVPETTVSNIAEVSATEFIHNVRNLSKLSDVSPQKEGNPISTVHFTFNEDSVAVMGTNSWTLAEVTIPLDNNKKSKGDVFLIHATQLGLLDGQFHASDSLQLVETADKFGYIDKNGILQLVAKSDFNPINYQTVFSKKPTGESVVLSTSSFKEAVNVLSKLSFDIKGVVVFSFDFNSGGVIAKNMTGNEVEVSYEDSNVDNLTVHFPKDSLNRLMPLFTDKVKLYFLKNDKGIVEAVRIYMLDKDGEELNETSTFMSVYRIK